MAAPLDLIFVRTCGGRCDTSGIMLHGYEAKSYQGLSVGVETFRDMRESQRDQPLRAILPKSGPSHQMYSLIATSPVNLIRLGTVGDSKKCQTSMCG